MSSPLLSLAGVSKSFERGHRRLLAVDAVDLELRAGETLGIVGESGCGKSTLARLALRLLAPSGGRVAFDGTDITDLNDEALRKLRSQFQIVFQDPNASLNPRWRVADIVGEPLKARGWSRQRRQARVAEVLDLVGLSAEAADRYPNAFSGGQRQRIGIARALAPSPRLIVCDEAVSALDASVQAQILNLLVDLQKKLGLSLLFISHNLAVIHHVSHRVAVMYLGQVVEEGSGADFFARPLHPYSVTLQAAVPEPDRPARYLARDGDSPDAANRPGGCHFHPRCPIARAECATTEPTLREAGQGRLVRCHFPGELSL